MSVFEELSKVDCSERVEKKGRFNYLPWSWAWAIFKQHCPDAVFHKHTFQLDGRTVPYMVLPDGTAMVQVTVSAGGEDHTETLAILNYQNQPIQNPSAWDVNVSYQRCLVKAIAFFGLGLYIYSGEDLPSDSPYTPEEEAEMVKADQEYRKENGLAF